MYAFQKCMNKVIYLSRNDEMVMTFICFFGQYLNGLWPKQTNFS